MPQKSYYSRTPVRSIPREDLATREPHQIVGTTEWAEVRQRVAILEGRSYTDLSTGNTTLRKLSQGPHNAEGASEVLIDKILEFVEYGEWAQIEGGEHDKRWINTRHYPNQIFETGQIKEAKTDEIYYFPLAATDDDPKGMAMHYEISAGGGTYTVEPNIWRLASTYVQRKTERRRARKANRRVDSLVEMEMAMNREE